VLAREDGDLSLLAEVEHELEQLLTPQNAPKTPYGSFPAIVTISAGTGGTEAQDWARMLLRMYVRWASLNHLVAEEIELLPGKQAGIKSVILRIKGKNSYLFFAPESGTHRLQRNSPFGGSNKRQTSFATVLVLPELPENEEIVIEPNEVREEFMHSSGPGGQNVQKVETGVRLVHLATKTTVVIKSGRSQYANRQAAWTILRGKLLLLKKSQETPEERGDFGSSWGKQIRTYSFNPTQWVKVHKSGKQYYNLSSIMDGNLKEVQE
jgi:peptide chain release factor 2